MKKSTKGIIGLTAALAVLGGGYAALVLTAPQEDAEDSSSVSESSEPEKEVKILIRDAQVSGTDPDTGADLKGVITKVDVTNRTDEIHVVKARVQNPDDDVTYTLQGCDDIKMKNNIIGTLANNINGLQSEDVIEEHCTDTAKFGFDDPAATVIVEFETGTKHRLIIGDRAPKDNVTYVMVDDLDTVFTVQNSKLANYSNTFNDFVSDTLLEVPDNYPTVKKLTIAREDLDTDIVLEYNKYSDDENYSGGTTSTHIMTEPTTAYLAVERSSDLITGMFGLTAEGIYSVHCEKADIAEAGLEEPFCTVEMNCDNGSDYKLLLSEPFKDEELGQCNYAMLDGGKVIFIIQSDHVKWATVQPVDIASRMVIGSYVWNVSGLTVTAGENEYAFDVKRTNPDEEKDSLKSEDFTAKLNGEDFSAERYRKFYSFLISMAAEDFALGEKIPSGKPMAAVEYTDSYTKEKFTLEFYEQSAMTALLTVNGESKFHVAKSFVETLIENADRLTTDEDFRTTWK